VVRVVIQLTDGTKLQVDVVGLAGQRGEQRPGVT
jgi:hypothetical protein